MPCASMKHLTPHTWPLPSPPLMLPPPVTCPILPAPSSPLAPSPLLQDGVSLAERTAPFHSCPLLQPLLLLDCQAGRQRKVGQGSLTNTQEAEMAAELYWGGAGGMGGREERTEL